MSPSEYPTMLYGEEGASRQVESEDAKKEARKLGFIYDEPVPFVIIPKDEKAGKFLADAEPIQVRTKHEADNVAIAGWKVDKALSKKAVDEHLKEKKGAKKEKKGDE